MRLIPIAPALVVDMGAQVPDRMRRLRVQAGERLTLRTVVAETVE